MGIILGIAQLGLGVAALNQEKKAAQKNQQAQEVGRRASMRSARREAQIKQAQMRAFAQGAGVAGGTYNQNPLSATLDSQIGLTGQQGLLFGEAAGHGTNANMLSGLSKLFGDAGGMFSSSKAPASALPPIPPMPAT
jgi:hypothetical protein